MVQLQHLVDKLDKEFDIKSFGKDPGFSRFIPEAYEPINFDWKSSFEHDFTELFNGLMIKGAPIVEKIFLAVFPTDSVLESFIETSSEGDLLFMHHPLLMECGDPRGDWGKGFVPIKEHYIKKMKEKNLSVYTCHAPLDYHKQLGTNISIVRALKADIIEDSLENCSEDEFVVCNISNTSTDQLIETLIELFEIPYVDFEGQNLNDIQKVAIVAGCGDKVKWMKDAEKLGVQAYITGEIHCHIDNEYGIRKYKEMKEYISETTMSLIGVSHSASEYLVKKTLIKDWLENNFDVKTVLIPQEKWWL